MAEQMGKVVTVATKLHNHEVYPLPDTLTLRTRMPPTDKDTKAEALLRDLIADYGRDPDQVLVVEPCADWPEPQDPPHFRFPQLIARSERPWQGLAGIELYIREMRALGSRTPDG